MKPSNQEILIVAISEKLTSKISLLDAIANALNISYDAAHRRVSFKSKFSIEETVQLAKHFGLSLDKLFAQDEYVLVKKTKEIQTFQDLSSYLGNSLQSLREYHRDTATQLFYSAKDIPLFYTIGKDLLSRFKLFVWLQILGFNGQEISFESFRPTAPIVENSTGLKQFYDQVSVHEIWNDTTINSTLQQVLYFFEAGLLSIQSAQEICVAIKDIIRESEQKCTPKNEQYRLYYHELLILNNNVLLHDDRQKSLFVPYTMLGYFITKDQDTCEHAQAFFQHQLKNSKLLNTAGTRDKKIFFNRMYQKVDFYVNQMTQSPSIF